MDKQTVTLLGLTIAQPTGIYLARTHLLTPTMTHYGLWSQVVSWQPTANLSLALLTGIIGPLLLIGLRQLPLSRWLDLIVLPRFPTSRYLLMLLVTGLDLFLISALFFRPTWLVTGRLIFTLAILALLFVNSLGALWVWLGNFVD